jgi:dipeptidyl aminopeptidase/acylaminoacyl peptidase
VTVQTLEYAPGRMADVYGDPAHPTVMMWHGAQTDARRSMRPLADRLAEHGFAVVVPDWDSHAGDRGRADLLRSVRFACDRSANPDGLVLVGWSLGGVAAAGLTIHAGRFDVRPAHTVCLAGAFTISEPISGEHLPSDLSDCDDRAPFTLLHGVADDVIPVAVSRDFASVLRRNAWPVQIAELPADHGSIAGATYDRINDRYSAADDPEALSIATDVAARIAAAASSSGVDLNNG